MGGLKRKLPLEKIEKKESRAVAFSKRIKGLYSKATELCLMSDAQIAIIATPVFSKSNASFYSFGHSSVDSVVAAFLSNQRPQADLGLGFWWEDESLAKSENPEELSEAISSMSTMLTTLRKLRSDSAQNLQDCHDDMKMKEKCVLHETNNTQTLNSQSSSAKDSEVIEDGELMIYKDLNEIVPHHLFNLDEHNNKNALLGNVGEYDHQDLDFDSIIDFELNSESLLKSLEMSGDDMNMKMTKSVEHGTDNNTQTLNLESSSAGICIQDDDVSIMAPNQNLCLDSEVFPYLDDRNNNDALLEYVQDLDFDSIIDFKTNTESLLKSLEMCQW